MRTPVAVKKRANNIDLLYLCISLQIPSPVMDRTYVIRLVRPFIKFLFELWSIWYETKVQDMLEVNNRVETVTATPVSNNTGKYMTGAFPHFEYLLGNGIFHSNMSYDKSSSWITHCFYVKKKSYK